MDPKYNVLSIGGTRSELAGDITRLMLKGAGYALIAFLLIWLMLVILALFGEALPAESRETQDPSPWSALEAPEALTQTV